MNNKTTDSRLPIIDPADEVDDIWLSISEAAKYGSMSTQRIYTAIKAGLSVRINPVTNVKEVPKGGLERWFCPFKNNAEYGDSYVEEDFSRQRIRISHLRNRVDILRAHIDDLKETIELTKNELELAHKREAKLLKIIERNDIK